MNTTFSLLERQLYLARYPEKHQHKSLQAWDSADELIIEHINANQTDLDTSKCIILNDDFGALGTWYACAPDAIKPVWYSDSWVAHRSLTKNLQANDCETTFDTSGTLSQPVTACTSLSELSAYPTLVIIKIPRTLALLEEQLITLSSLVTPTTMVIAAGKVKNITRTVLALFEKYIGGTSTSLAKKKSRLIFCEPDSKTLANHPASPYPTIWQQAASNGQAMTMVNHANVFSRQSLDIGARLLLDHMAVTNNERVIDLGCGNGVLGLNALALAPEAWVTFADESFMALQSARDSVEATFPDALPRCRFQADNCLETLLEQGEAGTADKVLCNPPFHQQNAVTDHIAWQMFHDSREILRRGGHLIVVANRHLGYHVTLKRLFKGVTVLASNRKFVILSAAKR
ncbi:methyltransferase [Salinimonas sp. HHU 13199]|uniref:Ribosomal RNA large subunit methyltransferase G n=1 Tax=Salinimonas profundi TaxID=2729140 RepID=A0ABR8LNI7_9ALTE|nr:methyltransferase [Salinimonas profundi]MBD3585987.1 methyltransferase [Salinimonas profundi]